MSEEEEEVYEITPEGIALALTIEAYMQKGLSLEEVAKKYDMEVEHIQVLMALMPNVTLADLNMTPDEIIGKDPQ